MTSFFADPTLPEFALAIALGTAIAFSAPHIASKLAARRTRRAADRLAVAVTKALAVEDTPPEHLTLPVSYVTRYGDSGWMMLAAALAGLHFGNGGKVGDLYAPGSPEPDGDIIHLAYHSWLIVGEDHDGAEWMTTWLAMPPERKGDAIIVLAWAASRQLRRHGV
jgi:hypothetical protein